MEKDLFEFYNELPEEVQKIIFAFDEEAENPRDECDKMLEALKPYGYTFEYYLHCEPFNLRKI